MFASERLILCSLQQVYKVTYAGVVNLSPVLGSFSIPVISLPVPVFSTTLLLTRPWPLLTVSFPVSAASNLYTQQTLHQMQSKEFLLSYRVLKGTVEATVMHESMSEDQQADYEVLSEPRAFIDAC